MKLELTTKQFRRLLDMAYIGNWILNSTRGDDRFKDYDDVESLLFAKAREGAADGAVSGAADPLTGLCRGRHPRGDHGI